MLPRALLVFLVLLNVSVALWWMLRGEPVVPDVKLPSGLAELQLVDAAVPLTAPSPTASTAPLTDTTPSAAKPAAAVADSPSGEAPAVAEARPAPVAAAAVVDDEKRAPVHRDLGQGVAGQGVQVDVEVLNVVTARGGLAAQVDVN